MQLTARFSEALIFAANLHRSQVRKGPGATPYLGHLLSVAAIVLEYGGTEDEAIAALLHDAVEDQGGPPTRELIRRLFGEPVAAIVDGCSDTDESPKPPWQLRKDRYIAHLRTAPPSVVLVSCADKLANARSVLKDLRQMGEAVWTIFHCTRVQSLWYYREVVRALRDSGAPASLLDELERTVGEIEALAATVTR